jgi:DNA (cytosine-5)-methyltransferase 1
MLDLFSGAGGAAKGYFDAGFDVVGVDHKPMPHYPFEFHCADALEVLIDLIEDRSTLGGLTLDDFAGIHASPPCQGYSRLRARAPSRRYYQLIEPTRQLLDLTELPYVIENVDTAPLRWPTLLCGAMFPPLRVIRHRLFESNVALTAPVHPEHERVFTYDKRKGQYGKLDQRESFVQVTGGGNCTRAQAGKAMGIWWMTKLELNEAIPPVYTQHIGEQLLQEIRSIHASQEGFANNAWSGQAVTAVPAVHC